MPLVLKLALLALLLCQSQLIYSAPAGAATLYVIDQLQVGVRHGPGADSATLDVIRTGEKVSLLGESGDKQWVKIATANNREGWVLRRYLSETPPAAYLLRSSSIQADSDVNQVMENLLQEKERDKAALLTSETQRQELESRLQRLSNDCASASSLRENLDQAQQKLHEQEQAMNSLLAQNQALSFTSNLRWFLAGGGVLLVGWVIGWLFGRRKRGASYSSGKLRY